jgi:hypothetical protein
MSGVQNHTYTVCTVLRNRRAVQSSKLTVDILCSYTDLNTLYISSWMIVDSSHLCTSNIQDFVISTTAMTGFRQTTHYAHYFLHLLINHQDKNHAACRIWYALWKLKLAFAEVTSKFGSVNNLWKPLGCPTPMAQRYGICLNPRLRIYRILCRGIVTQGSSAYRRASWDLKVRFKISKSRLGRAPLLLERLLDSGTLAQLELSGCTNPRKERHYWPKCSRMWPLRDDICL